MSLFSSPPKYTHLQGYVVVSENLALPVAIDTVLGWLKLPLDDERIRWEVEETATAVIYKLEEYLGISIFQRELKLIYTQYLKGTELLFGPHRSVTEVKKGSSTLTVTDDYTVAEGDYKSLEFQEDYLEKLSVQVQVGFVKLPASLSLTIKAATINAYEGLPILSADIRSQVKDFKRTIF